MTTTRNKVERNPLWILQRGFYAGMTILTGPLVIVALAIGAAAASVAHGSSDAFRNWVQVAPPAPGSESWYCDNYSEVRWEVSGSPGTPIRRVGPWSGEIKDRLPFEIVPSATERDFVGDRRVRQVADGWLVGFDNGEWGGGLWWFSQDGRKRRRLRPDTRAKSANAVSVENVAGFDEFNGSIIVFMGFSLDHGSGKAGRLFRVVDGAEGWHLLPLASLDGKPMAWLHDGDSMLIHSGEVLWRLQASGKAVQLHRGRFPSSPNSLALGASGKIYIGLRRFVLRLVPQGAGYEEEWLVPVDCRNFKLGVGNCECRP